MRAALKAARGPSEIVLYPDAPAARDGWKRMLDWFQAHGVGTRTS
jgi:dienelactone hydrolase